MKLVLGSGSINRREVLEQAGFEFEVVTADIDEKAIRHDDPQILVLALARAKAEAVRPKLTEPAILITADQVVVQNGKILEKPADENEARAFVRGYREHPMEAVNGLVVTNTATGKCVEGVDISKVYFDPIPDEAIEEAIKEGRMLHCAGAMRCEVEPFSRYVRRFDGTTDSTSGMPLKLLKKLMEQVA